MIIFGGESLVSPITYVYFGLMKVRAYLSLSYQILEPKNPEA
ncbi:unnamed protein product [Brugia timori]|uniref:Uncharacterized protein n=1 Tax=Brugia timori TaxID=42155 RepID=A0A0R3Q8J4_9BILA|nr:unnamed protein product [Brugia timori]